MGEACSVTPVYGISLDVTSLVICSITRLETGYLVSVTRVPVPGFKSN